MKIAHFADLHFSPDTLAEAERCFGFAVDRAIAEECDAAVIAGDTWDRKIDLGSPCVGVALRLVKRLADHMPVLILQGTFSHDAPGSLDVFRHVGAEHHIYVADEVEQTYLTWFDGDDDSQPEYRFIDASTPPRLSRDDAVVALFSTLPTINKAAIAAVEGAEVAGERIGDYVSAIFEGWKTGHAQAHQIGAPAIIVAHGTVHGSVTEHGHTMAGQDHEFTIGQLASSDADAVMLGHIHKQQTWGHPTGEGGTFAAYPGSIGRFGYGQTDEKGFLIWEFEGNRVSVYDGNKITVEAIHTPAQQYHHLEISSAPSIISELKAVVGEIDVKDAKVRIRYQVDEEARGIVDDNEVRALLMEAGAREVKVEPIVNPVQRVRSEAFASATSLQEKLAAWGDDSGNDTVPLLPLLERLHAEASALVEDETR